MGGMQRLHASNTLVLVSDYTKILYCVKYKLEEKTIKKKAVQRVRHKKIWKTYCCREEGGLFVEYLESMVRKLGRSNGLYLCSNCGNYINFSLL